MSSKSARKLPQVSDFPPEEVTPAVLLLLELCHRQQEEIQALRDELARWKGGNPRPPIRPSALERAVLDGNPSQGRRRGKPQRRKTQHLTIHEEITVPPVPPPPAGSRLKGYEEFTVQDLCIRAHNTRYRLERWVTPDGETLRGRLPKALGNGHFGAQLRAFVLYQYHHAHVTQPLLLEALREWGVELSAGQLNRLITEPGDDFHREKEALLRAGLQASASVHVDDTGARHRGHNGFCTHIGNRQFACFASTGSKSRINFLELLRAGEERYVLNEAAQAYMRAQGLPQALCEKLAALKTRTFVDRAAWQAALGPLGIDHSRHVRIATEGVLLGAVLASGINPELVIVSDDAGQFNVLTHALCWIHAERGLRKLLGFNDQQRAALARVRGEIWSLYQALKGYQAEPTPAVRAAIEARFEKLCTTRTGFASLDLALQRLHRNGDELLRVLEHPEIALHNNLAERDIREYVKKRKISGSTRSAAGRRCRDTFASLKKTCRKQGLSFWDYLLDRLGGAETIPRLATAIFGARAPASRAPPAGS